MARFLTSGLLLAIVQVCIAKPLNMKRWDETEIRHSWDEIPSGWELVGPAPADHVLDMRIGLKQDRLPELITSLFEVSDPSHGRYGAHLSQEEVNALVAPHVDTVDTVESWLQFHGVDPSSAISRTPAGNWISMNIPVELAEQMLNNKYNVYRHTVTSETIVRTLDYSLPSVLRDHVDVITPTTYFSTMRPMKSTLHRKPNSKIEVEGADMSTLVGTAVPSSCAKTITPACLTALYNATGYVPAATDTNKFGITGYLDEYASHSDLKTFFKKYRSDASGADFTVVKINGGGDDQSDPGVEANLDIQYALGLSYPTPNIFWSTGGSPPFTPDGNTVNNTNEPYLDWLNYVLNQTDVPQTITTSYADDEQTVPIDYATSVCNGFAQLGARGVSLFFGSGDDGVGGGDCSSNTGGKSGQFLPMFPSSCPYITSVGGTTGINPEVVATFSGGGFSNYFAQPDYQAGAVAGYLETLGNTNSGLYNASGRAYPDVAAQAENFAVVVNGSVVPVGGTSAATPAFAGIVSLLNDYRLSNGKPPLGFLNPLIYGAGAATFNDITSGSNPGCGTDGFNATKGWDPVTGLGTPNFGKLQPVVLAA